MIKHIVLLKLKNDLDNASIEKLFMDIGKIKNKIPGIMSFNYGKNTDTSANSDGYTHAYSMDFIDRCFFDLYQEDDIQTQIRERLREALIHEDAQFEFNHDLDFVLA